MGKKDHERKVLREREKRWHQRAKEKRQGYMRQKRRVKRVVKRWKISNVTFPWRTATLNDDTFISFLDHGRLESSDDGLLPDPGISMVHARQVDLTHLVKHVLQSLLRQS